MMIGAMFGVLEAVMRRFVWRVWANGRGSSLMCRATGWEERRVTSGVERSVLLLSAVLGPTADVPAVVGGATTVLSVMVGPTAEVAAGTAPVVAFAELVGVTSLLPAVVGPTALVSSTVADALPVLVGVGLAADTGVAVVLGTTAALKPGVKLPVLLLLVAVVVPLVPKVFVGNAPVSTPLLAEAKEEGPDPAADRPFRGVVRMKSWASPNFGWLAVPRGTYPEARGSILCCEAVKFFALGGGTSSRCSSSLSSLAEDTKMPLS